MIRWTGICAGLVVLLSTGAFAARNRLTVTGANGIALSEFRGFETWETVAPSQAREGLKAILGNPVMIDAYKAGIPANGRPVPDGAVIAKIEWTAKKNSESPYPVLVPGALKRVGFMLKDSGRFADTDGWGYAQWLYDAASDSFKPEFSDSGFGKTVCHQCHTLVKAKDFVFTAYPTR